MKKVDAIIWQYKNHPGRRIVALTFFEYKTVIKSCLSKIVNQIAEDHVRVLDLVPED
jgi:hypothetical protein